MRKKRICCLSGIVKRGDGLGFSVIFNTAEEARHYKEMFDIIIRSDGYRTVLKRGYHDAG